MTASSLQHVNTLLSAAPLLITWFGSGQESPRSRARTCELRTAADGKLVPQVVMCDGIRAAARTLVINHSIENL